MCPIEPGWCETTLHDTSDGARATKSDSSGGAFCCPECGTKLRMVGEGCVERADNWAPPDRVEADPQPPVASSPKRRSFRPSSPTVAADDAFVALVASVDPWTRLAASAEASNRHHDKGTQIASHDTPEGALAGSNPPILRHTASDAPLTRDAKPEPRRRSARSRIGLSLAVLGGIVFMVQNQLRSPDPLVRDSRAGLALDTNAAVMPDMQALPGTAAEAVAEPSVAEFDANAAANALDSAAERASSCRQAGDPSGVAMATVTIAPSGRVTTAIVTEPPFKGTATGSCVASAMRTALVPAFIGTFVTVEKAVTIR